MENLNFESVFESLDPEGKSRRAELLALDEEAKEAYRLKLLKKEGITIDDHGREFMTLPKSLSVVERLEKSGYPSSIRITRFTIKNFLLTKNKKDIAKAIKNNQWVYLQGPPSSGKTALANSLAALFLEKNKTEKASYINLQDLKDQLLDKETNITLPKVIKDFKNFVTLDDLTDDLNNDWASGVVMKILNYLHSVDIKVIICGMFAISDFKNHQHPTVQRIGARLNANCTVIYLTKQF